MSVKRISIRNLLSYRAIDIDIGNQLNVFVGKNGSGKSNFVNSLLFALTEKFSTYDRKILENNLVNDEQQPIQVSIVLDNIHKRLPYNNDEVTIMRQLTNRDEYFINGKSVNVHQFTNVLQCINISRQHYYNIVRQGKIAKIAQMKDTELFELLEEVSGVAVYQQKVQEVQVNIAQAQQEKIEIVKILNDLGGQIKQLQDERDSFIHLKEIQKEIQLHEIQLSMINAKNFEHQLVDINSEQSNLHIQLRILIQKQTELNNSQFKNNKEIDLYDSLISDQQIKLNELQKEEQIQEQQQQQLKQQLNIIDQQFQVIETYKQPTQNVDELTKELLSYQEQSVKIDKDIQYFQILQTDDPIKRFKDELQQLQKQSDGYQKEYQNIQKKIQKLKKELNEINQNEITQIQEQIQNENENINTQRKQLENYSIDLMEVQKLKQLTQQKSIKLQSELDIECHQFDKQIRDIYTLSLQKILAYAEKEQLIVYGVFAQLLNIKQKKLLPLIEAAGGPRLFSLIVNDSKTAKQIIDFNKEQQGCILRIYPLDLIEDRVQQFEVPKDAINLQEQCTLNGNFEKKKALIAKVIGKWVAVKDYQAALDISQKHEINCITNDSEIVYADSFLTKVGATKNQTNKIAQYQKIVAMRNEINQLNNDITQQDQQMQELQNKTNNIQQQIQLNKNKLQQLQLQTQNYDQIKKKQDEMQSLQILSQQLEMPIKEIENQIKEINKNIKNPKQIKKGLTNENKETLKQLIKDKQEISTKILNCQNTIQNSRLKNRKQMDQKQLNQLQQERSELMSLLQTLNLDKQNQNKFIKELQSSLDDYQKQIKKLLKEKDQLKQEYKSITLQIDNLRNQQTDINDQALEFNNQLQEIEKEKKLLDAFSELDEQLTKNQIIKKIKDLKSKFNHKFTQKDQSLFNKLSEIESKFQEYQDKLKNLKQIQNDFDQLIQMMDNKAESLLQDQLFKKFAENFRNVFLQIVPSGECSIKLIKGLKKSKKNWGVDLKVSFKNKEVQNWTTFSSGEKTVIAFAILVALQKCDPAPFYILDEFDAALDDNYRREVTQIILNLSQNAQYIIITFRPELVQINNENITYYKVSHHNQQSSIIKCTQQEAKKILKA